MSRRAAAFAATLTAVATTASLCSFQSLAGAPSATPTTVAAPATTLATAPSTSPVTTVGPATTATASPTTAPPTTIPGPNPRGSRRVASPVDIAKIRATSLPLRTMGITLAMVVAALAAAGFVYGRVRSRIPAIAIPKPAAAGPPPPAAPMPPPQAIPLPPPVVEDAVADTVIFEPPPSHYAPPVIAPPSEPAVAEPVVPEPVQPEPVQPEPTEPEPEPVVLEPVEPDAPFETEPVAADPETSEAPEMPHELDDSGAPQDGR